MRYDGKPPVFDPEDIKVASMGSLAGIISQTVVATTPPPKVYYYLNDHLGKPVFMVDENNVVVWEARYEPFGKTTVHPYSTVENNFRFPGQYFDNETGFHYNYHRYYDPRTGRYLRADPIGLNGGVNIYTYAVNNPINLTDHKGLWVIPALVNLARTIGSCILPRLIPLTPYIPITTKVAKDVLDQSRPSVTTGIQETYRNIKNMRAEDKDDASVCEICYIETELSYNKILEMNEKATRLATEMRYYELKWEMENYHIE